MTNKQQAMLEYTTQDIVRYLMEDGNLSMEDAMECFYSSDTFANLSNPETGLYLEESPYVYELYKMENSAIEKDGRI